MITTLNAIRSHRPCAVGWEKLLRTLGKTKADDEPVSIIQILDSNGLDDALWCLRAVNGHDREIRLYAVWCARQVQHLMTDPRSLATLDVAERFANGEATEQELAATWAAAWAAAGASAREVAWAAAGASAWAAAWAAAGASAREVAWASAREVAGASARKVAGASAREVAGASARKVARDAQEKRLREIGIK